MERGQFVQDLLLSTLLMDKVDLSGDFLQSVEDEFYVPSGRYLCIYSCNENTMRGAAKSLATPPAAFTVNMIKVIEVIDVRIP